MLRIRLLLAAAVLLLFSAACAVPTGPRTAAVPPAPATQATTPAATAATTGLAANVASEGSTPVSAAAGAIRTDRIRLELIPNESEARYRVREQLADRRLPSDAVGATKAISGSIVLEATGAIVREESRFIVDLRTLVSDRGMRDAFLRRTTLGADRFPAAEFVPGEARGLPTPLPASGALELEIVGDLTIRGVTRPTTWQAMLQVDGKEIAGTASTGFKFGDFGMTIPRVMSVLSVEDNIRLEMDFRMSRLP